MSTENSSIGGHVDMSKMNEIELNDEIKAMPAENFYWKIREAESLCASLSNSIEEESSEPRVRILQRKLEICMLSNVSSLIRDCAQKNNINLTYNQIPEEEASKVKECHKLIKEKLTNLPEKLQEIEDASPFFQYQSLLNHDDLSINDDDTLKILQRKVEKFNSLQLCQREMKKAEKCWRKNGKLPALASGADRCFQENSKYFFCSVTPFCGKQIKSCMALRSKHGHKAFASCLIEETPKINECIYFLNEFLEKDYIPPPKKGTLKFHEDGHNKNDLLHSPARISSIMSYNDDGITPSFDAAEIEVDDDEDEDSGKIRK